MKRTKNELQEAINQIDDRKIVIGCCVNDEYLKWIYENKEKVQFIEAQTARILVNWCLEFFEKYQASPKENIEQIYLKKLQQNKIQKEYAAEFEEDILPSLSDEYISTGIQPDILLKQTKEYFRKQELLVLIATAQYNIENGQTDEAEILIKTYQEKVKAEQSEFTVKNVADLLENPPPPMEWIINGLIPKGLTILAGAPKTGKSYFILRLLLRLSLNKDIFEDNSELNYSGATGRSLYLSLEDPEYRLIQRIKEIEPSLLEIDKKKLKRYFFYENEWERQLNGGQDKLENWLKKNINAKVIVIDTITKFWNKNGKISGGGQYAEDANIYAPLASLAHKYGVSIIVIQHLTKNSDKVSDVFESILGGAGVTGAADTLMVLRKQADGKVKLNMRGKDIADTSIMFEVENDGAKWTALGEAGHFMKTAERQEIYNIFSEYPERTFKRGEIVKYLKDMGAKISEHSVTPLLRKMVSDGQLLQRGYGQYKFNDTDFQVAKKLNRKNRTIV